MVQPWTEVNLYPAGLYNGVFYIQIFSNAFIFRGAVLWESAE